MKKSHWFLLIIVGFIAVLVVGIFQQVISFNNTMISLQEMKKAEIETTKVEYGQCIVKIIESNKVAKSYRDDVFKLADKAGSNLAQFNNQLLALVGTQVIPKMSAELRENVQREIISCRNAYTGRVDFNLKPMYINFNRLQRQFPNSIYNALFFQWKPEDLNMPKNDAAEKDFSTGKIKPLELN